jgi:hypothetical protein
LKILAFRFQTAYFIIRNNLLNLQKEQQEYGLYIAFLQLPWVDDVGAVSHPWVLIAISKSLRNATLPFLKDMCCMWKCKAATSHSITVQPAVNQHMREKNNLNRIGEFCQRK